MKATWRAKAQAYKAKSLGYEYMLIIRADGGYLVEMDDIISAELHSKVFETKFALATVKRYQFTFESITFRDFMSL